MNTINRKLNLLTTFLLLISFATHAQTISPAPQNIFEKFREAGMDPQNHILTPNEQKKIAAAFAILPPLHQKVLAEHLHSISFMDNMPNTALTSPVDTDLYNITFRAEILNQTISEWATWKENTCYEKSDTQNISLTVEAGNLEAIKYVLLHESTHIVDAVLNITPHPATANEVTTSTPFTQNIWNKMNRPVPVFIDTLLEKTLFRSGKKMNISYAAQVYSRLKHTPFASLYGMAAWFEDLAEITTIYHLTSKMQQPYRISVKRNGLELDSFEPMKNKLVIKRLKQLKRFYNKDWLVS